MLNRELLKRDPSAGRKLKNTILRNHERAQFTFPLQRCLARSMGAELALRS